MIPSVSEKTRTPWVLLAPLALASIAFRPTAAADESHREPTGPQIGIPLEFRTR